MVESDSGACAAAGASHLALRLPSLDGLRAISIFLVVLGHASKQMSASNPLLHGVWRGFLQADLGVTMFFGISGYLITTLLLQELDKTGCIRIKSFYIRRAFRICPAYYAFLSVVLLLAARGAIIGTPLSFASAAFYFWNYNFVGDPGNVSWFLGHCWSLCVEEQFYLLWPLALYKLGAQRGQRLAVILICVSPIIRVLTYFCFPDAIVRGHIGMMLHTRADALMFGALAAMLSKSPTFRSSMEPLYRRHLPLICASYLFFIKPCVAQFGGAYRLPIGFTLDSAACVLLILWAVQCPDTLVGKALNSKFLVHIGVISYSLYLWQQLFLTSLNPTITGVFPLNIAFALIAAECSYFLIERFFLRLRTKVAPAV